MANRSKAKGSLLGKKGGKLPSRRGGTARKVGVQKQRNSSKQRQPQSGRKY